MTDTVSTTTDKLERETRQASELKPGDWVLADPFDVDFDGLFAEILHAQNYTEFDTAKALLVLRIEGDTPQAHHVRASLAFELASAAEIAVAKDAARRWELAEQLRELANMIVDRKLPLPTQGIDLLFHYAQFEVAKVDEVGKTIGIEPVTDFGQREVSWPGPERERPMQVRWYAFAPESNSVTVAGMVAARELDDDEPEPIPDGVSGNPMGRPVSAPPAIQTRAQCLPGCYEPIHVADCPVLAAAIQVKQHCPPSGGE